MPETCSYLNQINLSNCGDLTDLENLSQCTELSLLDVSDCDINQLSLSNSTKLRELKCGGNPLTSLDVSNCPKLGIGKNKWGNPYKFSCISTNITCIKVSQEQLDNTQKNWEKDDRATYNTNCN